MRLAAAKSPLLAAAALTGLVASCANGPEARPTLPPVIEAETGPIQYAPAGDTRLDAWREGFSERAMAAGYDRALVKSMLSDLSPISLWLGAQAAATDVQDQAEFSKPIWEYLKVPMGPTRISTGQEKLTALAPTLEALEARYGVDRQVLLAIWGMETSFGGYIGNFDAPNALANMAAEGRRQKFAEGEIYALMKLVNGGHVAREDLVAGWAGAMGQTQFMPSTFLAFGQDFDGDNNMDIWKSEADALGSAANYLAKSGYQTGQAWGVEVIAPTGFDFSLADGKERSLADWKAAGLSPIVGGDFNTGGADFSELWLPAGAMGPKYLLFKNFKVFRVYNRADSYAFAIGMTSDAFLGNVGPVTAWPTHLKPLAVFDIKRLQAGLAALGFDPGPVDGIPGRQTKSALQAFQKSKGLLADGYPTKEMLDLVLSSGSPGVASSGLN